MLLNGNLEGNRTSREQQGTAGNSREQQGTAGNSLTQPHNPDRLLHPHLLRHHRVFGNGDLDPGPPKDPRISG